ncbi:MAG: hypothetical protein HKN87_18565 [Saprospiraceae bacterium]|nr:hypothetical protein [Saprospiraceae bacterium]
MFRDQPTFPKKRRLAKGFFFVLAAIFFLIAMGVVVMLLWNAILPQVLGVRSISFWQAVGILVLAKILFGFPPFGKGGGMHRGSRSRWRHMSDEDKIKIKAKWRARCEKRDAE